MRLPNHYNRNRKENFKSSKVLWAWFKVKARLKLGKVVVEVFSELVPIGFQVDPAGLPDCFPLSCRIDLHMAPETLF